LDVLQASPTFSALPPIVLELLAGRMEERRYRPGEYLMRQGEPGDSLILIAEGVAEVAVTDARGERIVLARPGRGEVVGEMALLTDERRTADVIATGDLKALVLRAEDFRALAARHPVVSVVLTDLAAKRLGSSEFDALRGKILGRYRIVRCLGRGGMAVVYEARGIEHNKRVALKMLSHRLVYDTKAFARFQREADIVAALRHENICSLFDRFAAYGTYFLVMEYCDGPSLDKVVQLSTPLPEEKVRALAGQLAKALAYVHAQGVVHRDLKPSNVLFTSAGTAKLADFGIAKPQDAAALTAEGTILGTPRYMAPEQLGGRPAGKEADIYAMGCLIYTLLTGCEPFEGSDLTEILYQKLTWRLPPRSSFGQPVSSELYDLLCSCLHAEPEKRKVDLSSLSEWAAPVPLGELPLQRPKPPSPDDPTVTLS